MLQKASNTQRIATRYDGRANLFAASSFLACAMLMERFTTLAFTAARHGGRTPVVVASLSDRHARCATARKANASASNGIATPSRVFPRSERNGMRLTERGHHRRLNDAQATTYDHALWRVRNWATPFADARLKDSRCRPVFKRKAAHHAGHES